jgi:hypothetical protein
MDEIRTDGERKLAELILYVSRKCASDPKFGATKLNKILYLSDFWAYGQFGHAITGVEYCHRDQGPAPTRLVPIRRYLERKESLMVQKVHLKGGRCQHRTISLRDPILDDFSNKELSLVDSVISYTANWDSDDASEFTHEMVGWKITEMDEPIPYATIFLSDEPLAEWEIKKAEEISKRALSRGLPVAIGAY